MNLKHSYFSQEVCGLYMAAAPDSNKLVNLNESGAFVFSLLREETTEEAIVDAVCKKYDASREIVAKDVKEIISQLREANMLI